MGSYAFPGRFTIHGLDARFERGLLLWSSASYDRMGSPGTEVSVKLGGRSPGALKIFQKGLSSSVSRIFGASVFRSGDKLFDSLYGIYARPASLAARLFAPERQSSVIASVRRIGAYVDPLIDLSGNRLLVQVRESLEQERGVRNLVATATDLVGYLLELAAGDGSSIGPAEPAEGARCPVCMAPLQGESVHCPKCRTPHHGDCWTYLGKCSIFACGGTRAPEGRRG